MGSRLSRTASQLVGVVVARVESRRDFARRSLTFTAPLSLCARRSAQLTRCFELAVAVVSPAPPMPTASVASPPTTAAASPQGSPGSPPKEVLTLESSSSDTNDGDDDDDRTADTSERKGQEPGGGASSSGEQGDEPSDGNPDGQTGKLEGKGKAKTATGKRKATAGESTRESA